MNKKKILKFLLRFNALAIPLYLITYLGFQIHFIQDIVAKSVLFFLHLTDVPAVLKDLMIVVPVEHGNFGGVINWDCTGWKSFVAFVSLVIATDTTWHKRLRGFAFLPLIFIVNLIRVWFSFFFVYMWGPEMFEIVHDTLWSWGLIATILVLWYIWLTKIVHKNEK